MAVEISEARLLECTSRLEGQTVLITGSSNGINISRVSAQAFAERGANIVIGNLDEEGSNTALARIQASSKEAFYQKCDVSQWDDQVQLFEAAQAKFGSIDVVIINALDSKEEETQGVDTKLNDLPSKPNINTLEVFLYGVIYSMHLAIHYLQKSTRPNSLKAVVILGSIRAFDDISGAAMLAAANSAVFGVMASLRYQYSTFGLRISMVAASVDAEAQNNTKVFEPSQSRISDAIVLAATDSNKASNGAVYILQNHLQITCLPASLFELKVGVHNMLRTRLGL